MEWISVKDRLPPKDTKVLCYYYDEYMDVMEYWNDDDQGSPQFWSPPSPPVTEVTHWLPLPEKPMKN